MIEGREGVSSLWNARVEQCARDAQPVAAASRPQDIKQVGAEAGALRACCVRAVCVPMACL
jgi:hypothetical protein